MAKFSIKVRIVGYLKSFFIDDGNYRLFKVMLGIAGLLVAVSGIWIGADKVDDYLDIRARSIEVAEDLMVYGSATTTGGFVVGEDNKPGPSILSFGTDNMDSWGCIEMKIRGSNEWMNFSSIDGLGAKWSIGKCSD